MSGGRIGAEKGTLTVMVGGDPAAFEQVRPILEVIGKNVLHMGDKPGLGQSMKLVNNMLTAAGTLAAMEVLVAGAKVLGNIEVGEYAKVASGSVVLKPVPSGCTAAGVPARLVNCPTCEEPAKSMDHTARRPPPPAAATTVDYGRYLAEIGGVTARPTPGPNVPCSSAGPRPAMPASAGATTSYGQPPRSCR